MKKEELIPFFERDLNILIAELEAYKNEENIWRVEKNISNSAGNLVLHLIGNLHTFIGKEIGKTNYVRNRDLEFSQKNVPRQELIDGIHETLKMVKKSILSLSPEALKKEYTVMKFPTPATTEYLIVHLAIHLSYHLGQINYHRRSLEE